MILVHSKNPLYNIFTHYNTLTVYNTFTLTLLQCLTQRERAGGLFFVVFFVVAFYMLYNLFIGVIVQVPCNVGRIDGRLYMLIHILVE
jgi:hypothetical protein